MSVYVMLLYKSLAVTFDAIKERPSLGDLKNFMQLFASSYISKKDLIKLLGLFLIAYFPYSIRFNLVIKKIFENRKKFMSNLLDNSKEGI